MNRKPSLIRRAVGWQVSPAWGWAAVLTVCALALLLWAAAFAPSSGAWLTDADQAAGEFHAGEWITLTPTVLPSFTPETLVPTADVILPATVTPVPVLLPTATPEPVIVEPTEAPSATALPTEAPSDPEPIPTETPLPEMTGEPAAP